MGLVLKAFDTNKAKRKKQPSLIIGHKENSNKKEFSLSEQTFRLLYQTTQDGIMARDLEGKMIDCNPAYAKMLGYTKRELKQKTIKDLLPKNWLEQRERIVSKVLQTGRTIVFEREYRRKDGSIFPASVRTWRLINGKGLRGGLGGPDRAHLRTLRLWSARGPEPGPRPRARSA
jgi:PAS domain S-box-containing protein